MKIVIESITDWRKDKAAIEGDRNHGGLPESDILLTLARETMDKKESKWTKGLPFTWEKDVEIDSKLVDIGLAVQTYLEDALTEYSNQYCADDYLKPDWFEGRVVA